MLTVLQVPQLGTLGITGPHNSTYPEYSWVVSCVVLCYAVGVLCYAHSVLYAMLCTTYLYSITLAMLYAYTEVEGYYSLDHG